MKKYIVDYVQTWAEQAPSHTALIFQGTSITYGELFARVEKTASGLIHRGAKPGDYVAYMMPPCPQFYYLYLAASIVGCPCVGLNVRSKPAEIIAFLKKKQPKLFVVDNTLINGLPNDLAGVTDVLCPNDLISPITPSVRAAIDHYRSGISPDSIVFEICSSGTSGQASCALLTQENILTACLAQLREFGAPYGYQPDDLVQQVFPVNHVSGAVEFGVAPLLCGSALSVHPLFSPQRIMDDIQHNAVTMMVGVPAMWEAILRHPSFQQCDFSRIRWCGVGAAPVREEILRQMLDISGVISNPLGMTELSGFCSAFGGITDWTLLRDSVGKIIPELEWKIVDDNYCPVCRGEIGQLAYRGASVISSYADRPLKKTADGFFLSGDLAFYDNNGYIHLRGRIDDQFQVGGYNVVPIEIENEILSYPGILQTAVVPVPHRTMGSVCHAYVVPKRGCQIDSKKLIDWLDDRLIYYKVPRSIHVCESLPTNELGKVLHKSLIAHPIL